MGRHEIVKNDVRGEEGFVGFAYTRLDAELWIVERLLAEKSA